MPSPLIIPGVQVRTVFEPSPALPSLTGVLGVVGVADRGPLEPTPVGSVSEFLEIFGPASRYSMPEVRTAFSNGISLAFIARIAPGRGQKARLVLNDDEGEQVVTLIARAEGDWGNRISVRVSQVKTVSGRGVKYVNLEVFLDGEPVETHNGLVMDESSPDYLFDRINQQSRVLVAVDPVFESGLPQTLAKTALADAQARAAFALLKSGAADVVRAEAKSLGGGGNRVAVRVREGQAALPIEGAANAPSLLIQAVKEGSDGTGIRVNVVPAGNDVSIVITPAEGAPRTLGPFNSVDAIVEGLKNDPAVRAVKQGTVLPAPLAATALRRRVHVDVVSEGRDTSTYLNLADLDAVAAVDDPLVKFSVVGAATQLPDATPGVPLGSGRDAGAALALIGDGGQAPLLELAPAKPPEGVTSISLSRAVSTVDGATAVVNLTVFVDDAVAETFLNLTMDPDDERYFPTVLQSSALLRAHDLFVRSRTTSMPAHMARPKNLASGLSPVADDYQDALDRLESAEEVDLVIASVANQLTDAGVRQVHQQVVAHCSKMADVARNRIGLGSPTRSETSVGTIIDHANDVRSDYFIFCAPAGMEAAVAGLLARQQYFESPTFKTIAAPGAAPGKFTDAQLTQLITNNVLAVNERRRLGILVIKGLLTSGRQINVQRTANKAVRDVKAICENYIGLLNNDGARNALRQQITALLLQMERDGALVPSTDGKDPAFRVEVYSTQADFANGIVRADIAVRPVRAIDYIYATILVKN